jgi:hypothetical protein
MTLNDAPPRPSARTLATIEADGTISRSMTGVSAASVATSSDDRTRDEWTVAITTAVPAAIAARAPTTSARYMCAWRRSISLRTRYAVSSPTAASSSASSMTSTSRPSRRRRWTADPLDSERARTSYAERSRRSSSPV